MFEQQPGGWGHNRQTCSKTLKTDWALRLRPTADKCLTTSFGYFRLPLKHLALYHERLSI